jgi:hypothetical protein
VPTRPTIPGTIRIFQYKLRLRRADSSCCVAEF